MGKQSLCMLDNVVTDASSGCPDPSENGGEKLVHGSGGMVSLRAEQNSAR